DQSIYGFRGANVRLFGKIREEIQHQEIFLQENYRTPPQILQAANALIAHNSGRSGNFARAQSASKSMVRVFAAKDAREEARYIAEQTLSLVGGVDALSTQFHRSESEYAFSDIAVLCRTHAAAGEIIRALRHQGIPLTLNTATSLWDSPPFTLVGSALKFLCNPRDGLALAELAEGLSGQKKQNEDRVQRIRSHLAGNLALEDFAAGDAWKEWVEIYRHLTAEEQRAGTWMPSLLDFFCRDTKLDEEQEGEKETLLRLAREAEEPISDFVRKQILSPRNNVGKLGGGVHVLTFHAAKGLEFPVVILAGAEEGITPSGYQGTDVEEERRLFYVAMTRAQQELRITHAGKRTLQGQERMLPPSRFLRELDSTCTETIHWRPAGTSKVPQAKQLELF
ncbi:MAG TPA: ATP-dependent helicase, partial [Fibrobacteraceae bacterium]|nr:ATP-dependent helicase [Fibrobacteraceae bacterium]